MNLSWYSTLTKPLFTPNPSIFAPAWSILYILMALSMIYFIRKDTDKSKTAGCVLFIIQLLLNLLWPPVFFMFHQIQWAFIIACLMLLFTVLTATAFFRISKLSAVLLFPYILWLCFAIYLNYGFLVLNP